MEQALFLVALVITGKIPLLGALKFEARFILL